MKDYSNK